MKNGLVLLPRPSRLKLALHPALSEPSESADGQGASRSREGSRINNRSRRSRGVARVSLGSRRSGRAATASVRTASRLAARDLAAVTTREDPIEQTLARARSRAASAARIRTARRINHRTTRFGLAAGRRTSRLATLDLDQLDFRQVDRDQSLVAAALGRTRIASVLATARRIHHVSAAVGVGFTAGYCGFAALHVAAATRATEHPVQKIETVALRAKGHARNERSEGNVQFHETRLLSWNHVPVGLPRSHHHPPLTALSPRARGEPPEALHQKARSGSAVRKLGLRTRDSWVLRRCRSSQSLTRSVRTKHRTLFRRKACLRVSFPLTAWVSEAWERRLECS